MRLADIRQAWDDDGMVQSIERTMSRIAAILTGTVKVAQRSDFGWAVSRGELAGHRAVQIIGFNDGVGTTEETIWEHSGRFVPAEGSAETLNIVSTDVDDDGDPVDTGARTLLVVGLDAAGAEITEVVTLNGTSNVLTTQAFAAVNALLVVTAGASRFNEGAITATQSSSGLVLNQIGPELSLSRSGIYTVPAGKMFVARNFIVIPGEISGATAFLHYHAYVYRASGVRIAIRQGHAINEVAEPITFVPVQAPGLAGADAGDTIELTGFVDAGTSTVQAILEGILVDA